MPVLEVIHAICTQIPHTKPLVKAVDFFFFFSFFLSSYRISSSNFSSFVVRTNPSPSPKSYLSSLHTIAHTSTEVSIVAGVCGPGRERGNPPRFEAFIGCMKTSERGQTDHMSGGCIILYGVYILRMYG